ncbi:Vacuolar protein sorting-associated protein vta1 [Nowakowskiella sp. JEL0078]|nr:Vacuolar protein sorting-associated protein vta1 [Nowakowskiella sp. JEL0078]
MKIFDKADNEDLAGKASKYVEQFIIDLEGKIKYAKFRAIDILKSIKEGRIPTPGNIEPNFVDSASILQSPTHTQNMIHGATQQFSEMPQQFSQTIEQTSLTPSAPHLIHPLNQTNPDLGITSYPQMPEHFSFQTQNHQIQSFQIQPQIQPHKFSSPQPQFPTAVQESVQQFSNISSAQISPFEMDHKSITDAQKFTRFAISALQYEDVPTAIENLKKGLKLLENMQPNELGSQHSHF